MLKKLITRLAPGTREPKRTESITSESIYETDNASVSSEASLVSLSESELQRLERKNDQIIGLYYNEYLDYCQGYSDWLDSADGGRSLSNENSIYLRTNYNGLVERQEADYLPIDIIHALEFLGSDVVDLVIEKLTDFSQVHQEDFIDVTDPENRGLFNDWVRHTKGLEEASNPSLQAHPDLRRRFRALIRDLIESDNEAARLYSMYHALKNTRFYAKAFTNKPLVKPRRAPVLPDSESDSTDTGIVRPNTEEVRALIHNSATETGSTPVPVPRRRAYSDSERTVLRDNFLSELQGRGGQQAATATASSSETPPRPPPSTPQGTEADDEAEESSEADESLDAEEEARRQSFLQSEAEEGELPPLQTVPAITGSGTGPVMASATETVIETVETSENTGPPPHAAFPGSGQTTGSRRAPGLQDAVHNTGIDPRQNNPAFPGGKSILKNTQNQTVHESTFVLPRSYSPRRTRSSGRPPTYNEDALHAIVSQERGRRLIEQQMREIQMETSRTLKSIIKPPPVNPVRARQPEPPGYVAGVAPWMAAANSRLDRSRQ